MGLFRRRHDAHLFSSNLTGSSQQPPEWTSAPEAPHQHGLYNEATDQDYIDGQRFFEDGSNPREPPRLLPSDAVDRINRLGCKAWGLESPTFYYPYSQSRFSGFVQNLSDTKGGSGLIDVKTNAQCEDVCLLSNLPIMAGLYDIQGKTGVYFEVLIEKMNGVIAIGTACRPYPSFRLPGWHRDSAGFHLDDLRKFFENSDGGQDYQGIGITRIKAMDTVGCGYEFSTGSLFYTYNGARLPSAFIAYVPRQNYDVFATIGVAGECEFKVNFGGDIFRWKEGNEWAWRVEGHIGRLGTMYGGLDEELPSYNEVRRMQ